MGFLSHRPAAPIAPRAASHRHAMATLRERGIPVARIVRVDPYAVSFLSQQGEIVTAWMVYVEDREKCLIWTQPGLPAFP